MIIRDEDPPIPTELCSHEHITTMGTWPLEVTVCFDCETAWPVLEAPFPQTPIGMYPDHTQPGVGNLADTIITP